MSMNVLPVFSAAAPEIFILAAICVILLVDLFLSKKAKVITYILTQLALIVAFVLTYRQLGVPTITTFHGNYVVDNLAVLLKLFVYLATFFMFIYARSYVANRKIMRGEFHILILLSMLGAMVLISAASLLTLYLGLELLSLPLYALVAIRTDEKRGSEAAMKYFVMGALASGILLYGFSLIYGATGSIFLPAIAAHISTHMLHAPILIFGLVFVVVAISFKFGAVPFHMWVPDVYEGSPTPVTAYLGTVPKLAAFALLIRLVVTGLGNLEPHWHLLFMVLAILSLLVGNLLALVQTNLKRMFGYSTISHVGFIFLGISIGAISGYQAALFYVIAYVIMASGGFGVIMWMSKSGFEADNIADLAGLNYRNSWFALMMMFLMFSMAGVPPFLGFTAKLYVLDMLVAQHAYYLTIFALLMSVIGACYYIRVVKVMYFDKPIKSDAITAPADTRIALSINAIAVLALGILPAGLLGLCHIVF